MPTILLWTEPERLSKDMLARVATIAPDMDVLVTHNSQEVEAALDGIEIAAMGFPSELLPRASKLRWMQQWSSGVDWLMRQPEAVEMSFVLTNTSGIHRVQISEHIFAFLLAFARELHRAIRFQDRCEWVSQNQHRGVFELDGKTMLLIGVGAVGERTAKVARAFGMRVLGVRRSASERVPNVEAMFGPDQLLDVLPAADYVVITAPLTHETQGLIGEQELRAMRPAAYLVNVGRGGLIQQDVLIRALQEGWIAGAGLDVFEDEPLPEGSPLWTMDNVIVTSHYAGITPYYDERAMAIFLDNLRRYRAGEPLRNIVDKKLGY